MRNRLQPSARWFHDIDHQIGSEFSAHLSGSFSVRSRPVGSEHRYTNPMVALLGQHGVNTFGLLDRYRLKEIHLRIDIRRIQRWARVLRDSRRSRQLVAWVVEGFEWIVQVCATGAE